jgi:hypothetical protein
VAKEEIVPRLIRMPKALLARLTELAHRNRRSVNAEVVFRLEESIRDQERHDQADPH